MLALAVPGLASSRLYLKKNETFCSTGDVLCLRGTLWYEPNPRLLQIRARVLKQTGPGTIRMRFSGTNRSGHQHWTVLSVTIKGKHSEIVERRMQPGAPDVQNWTLASFEFLRPL